MNRTVLYLRLSKEDLVKEDESSSIINQRLLLTDYTIDHNFTIVDTYKDEDFSGLYDDRPEFDRLIRDAKLGKFDVVIAKSQSRFTRNMEHMEKYLHHLFPLLGIRFIGVVDGVDTNIQANKKARQIYGLTNEWYCEDLSANIKSVFRQKMKAGQYLGSFAPYGYLKDPKDGHRFIVDDYAADVVRKIYSLCLQGYSNRAICRMLEDEQILNPTSYKQQDGLNYANAKSNDFSTKYHFWSETTIKRILTNRTYIGHLEQGRWEKVSYKDKKVIEKPMEEWIVVENHHEAILIREVFYQVQELRRSRRVAVGDDRKKVHLFAGKLKCADCHSTMTKSSFIRGSQEDWYYRCQLSNKSRKTRCSPHSIKYSVIAKTVLDEMKILAEPIFNEKDAAAIVRSLLKIREDHPKYLKDKLQQKAESEDIIEKAASALQMMYSDRINGTISEKMFAEIVQKTEKDMNQQWNKIKELEEEILKLSRKKNGLWDQKELTAEYFDLNVLTHEMIADFVDHILIGKEDPEGRQEISIYWNF